MTDKIEVDLAEIRQITAWLAATDIGSIEISRPGVTVRLKIDDEERGGKDTVRAPPAPGASASSSRAADASHCGPQAVTVTAKTVGVFLAAHPARATPFVEAGAQVGQGDVIGLLQIAHLCVPVVAPAAGVVAQPLVAHGAMVGYGTVLFGILPTHDAHRATPHSGLQNGE
ncbi:biotin/lipoyl-containing protein [Paraburkholderia sp. HD33-4]|uniref:biotin/lipoyl-containing protein n=1 Tax=Paraburkholderia sp. HD33-4 TaxID=2883242 RepID=UPI001F3B3FA0|nr:biotin/lipoyl-containing protein [Paraburkholderia sp. HD33-4]